MHEQHQIDAQSKSKDAAAAAAAAVIAAVWAKLQLQCSLSKRQVAKTMSRSKQPDFGVILKTLVHKAAA